VISIPVTFIFSKPLGYLEEGEEEVDQILTQDYLEVQFFWPFFTTSTDVTSAVLVRGILPKMAEAFRVRIYET